MGDSSIWVPLLVGVQILGIVMALVAGGWLYRTSIEEAERRRDAGLTDYAPDDPRVSVRLLKAKAGEELHGRELVVLQTLAKTLTTRRPAGLGAAAFSFTQVGWLFMDTWISMKVFAVLFAAFYLVAAVGIERNARVGAAFLQRHPLPAATT